MINQEDDMEKREIQYRMDEIKHRAVEESLNLLMFNMLGDLKQYEEGVVTEDIPFTKEETAAVRDIIYDIRDSEEYDDIADYLFEGFIGLDGGLRCNRKGEKALHKIIASHPLIKEHIFIYDRFQPMRVPTRKELVRDLKATKNGETLLHLGNYPDYLIPALISKYGIKNEEWLSDKRHSSKLNCFTAKITKEELESSYDEGLSIAKVSKKFGVTFDHVLACCVLYDVPYEAKCKKQQNSLEEIIDVMKQCINEGAVKSKIIGLTAKKLGMRHDTLNHYLQRNNIKLIKNEKNNSIEVCITTI